VPPLATTSSSRVEERIYPRLGTSGRGFAAYQGDNEIMLDERCPALCHSPERCGWGRHHIGNMTITLVRKSMCCSEMLSLCWAMGLGPSPRLVQLSTARKAHNSSQNDAVTDEIVDISCDDEGGDIDAMR
jgi:hypothetical protein